MKTFKNITFLVTLVLAIPLLIGGFLIGWVVITTGAGVAMAKDFLEWTAR